MACERKNGFYGSQNFVKNETWRMNDFLISKTKKFQFCHIFFLLCIYFFLIFRQLSFCVEQKFVFQASNQC